MVDKISFLFYLIIRFVFSHSFYLFIYVLRDRKNISWTNTKD